MLKSSSKYEGLLWQNWQLCQNYFLTMEFITFAKRLQTKEMCEIYKISGYVSDVEHCCCCLACNIDMWRVKIAPKQAWQGPKKKNKTATAFDSWKYKHLFQFIWCKLQKIVVHCLYRNQDALNRYFIFLSKVISH